jgi:ABC-type dipeptide/oligopeptide/nickel transport systems, permease components
MEINKSSEFKKKSIFYKISEVLVTMASKPSGFIGLSILVFHILLAFSSPYLAPYDFKAIDPSLMLQAPSSEYWFGTDSLGRERVQEQLWEEELLLQ